jgi:FkbM family methyltransferase
VIRNYLGDEYLSPIQRFAKDGYNDVLYRNLDITQEDVIVVLGGFFGDSAEKYQKNFGCHIHIYEPVGEFYKALQSRFNHSSNIQIFNQAVSISAGTIELSIEGEKTGQFSNSGNKFSVEARDISEIVVGLGTIDLLESNIEGGEYPILMKLIDLGQISRIRILQVQFHKYNFLTEVDRSRIRFELSKTHDLVFDYEWVWERWELREFNIN